MTNTANSPRTTQVKKGLRSGNIKNYKKGSRRLYITMMNGENSYDTQGVWVEGLIEVNLTLASEVTSIGADDNPSYISLPSPMTGTGTIKVTGMPLDALKYITSVEVTPNGVIYGADKEVPRCAFKYEERLNDGTIDQVIMFDATLSMPTNNAKSDDGKTIKDCTLNVTLAPINYLDMQGVEKSVTVFTTNSGVNADTFAKFKDGIPYPTWELLHEPATIGGGE